MINSAMATHFGDDDVERYSTGEMSAEESGPFEEHLLICSQCRDLVSEHDLYLQAIRKAAPAARATAESRSRLWILRPIGLAAAPVLLLACGLMLRTGIEPQTIQLEATRGVGAKALPDRPLVLQPDLRDLPSQPNYRLEIVNELGGRVFETGITAARPQATVPGVPPGIYFVRVYTAAGEILREYSIDTR